MSGEGWSRQLGRALERVDTDQEQCCMSDSEDTSQMLMSEQVIMINL